MAYLKRAILTSLLVAILGLDDIKIDWEDIFIKSLALLQKESLDYAKSHPDTSTKDIARLHGVHPSYPARILMEVPTAPKGQPTPEAEPAPESTPAPNPVQTLIDPQPGEITCAEDMYENGNNIGSMG